MIMYLTGYPFLKGGEKMSEFEDKVYQEVPVARKMDVAWKMAKLEELALPIQKWLAENYDPHCKIEITTADVEVFSGEIRLNLEYPYKD